MKKGTLGKILYLFVTFVIGGAWVFGTLLPQMGITGSTYNVLSGAYLVAIIVGYVKLFGKKTAQKSSTAAGYSAKSSAVAQTASKPAAKTSSGLIATDFFTAIPGALGGLVFGFILFVVFGLLASLTLSHPITNIFGKLGVLCLFGCTIFAYVSQLKQQPILRKQKAERQAAAQRLEQNLSNAFNTLNTASTSTPEGVERYGKACDFLLWAFSAYHSAPESSAVISKYRHLCYARTYPFYRWTNGRYQYVPGTELAEEIQKEFHRVTEEREALFNKKY